MNYKKTAYTLNFIRLRNKIEGLKIYISRLKERLRNCNNEIEEKNFLDDEIKYSYKILDEIKEEYNEIK